MLTLFYERCSRYYGASGGQGSYGGASDEEKKLTMTLFSSIFDSLSKMEYDPELFGKALPCLTAIACALPPDCAKSDHAEDDMFAKVASGFDIGPYLPQPIPTEHVGLTNELNTLVQKFSEHYHDAWAQRKLEAGWTYGERRNHEQRKHDRLKPYSMLDNVEKETYREPIRSALKALIALNWQIEYADSVGAATGSQRQMQQSSGATDSKNPHNYHPNPADMTNLTLSKEMMNLSERLSEDIHDIQASETIKMLHGKGCGPIHLTLVPYDLLTESEKRKNRERCQELLKYIQYQGYNLHKSAGYHHEKADKNPENRFANSLLDKLIMYLDTSSSNMKLVKPSANFTRRNDFKKSNMEVKFFFKVVLPVIEKYFSHHRAYFTTMATGATAVAGVATILEKEYVATLFCKLASLLRLKMTAFGSDVQQAVKCLQVLIKAVDAR